MTSVEHGIGLPGVGIHSQDHICALFNGEAQRDEILFSFLQAGIDDGDKCVVILDHDDPSDVLARFADRDSLEAWQADGTLDVTGTPPTLTAGDRLSVEQMLAKWDGAVEATAAGSPFDFVRVTGDLTWWTHTTDDDTIVRYESALTSYVPEHLGVLCLHDVAQLSGPLLIDTVRAHPQLLVGSVVIENPYYLPPAELEAVRHGSGPTMSPTDYDIYQLANVPRVDLTGPVVELECDDCGAVLYVGTSGDREEPEPDPRRPVTTWSSPTRTLDCARCGVVWILGAGGLSRALDPPSG